MRHTIGPMVFQNKPNGLEVNLFDSGRNASLRRTPQLESTGSQARGLKGYTTGTGSGHYVRGGRTLA